MRTTTRSITMLAPLLCLAGCNSGLAALFSAASDPGAESTNAGTSQGDLSLDEARTSPALISFKLTDNEGDPASVQLAYSVAGGPILPIALAAGEAPLSPLETSPNGTTHERWWDFDSQLGSHFRDDVVLIIEVLGSEATQSIPVSLGNDAPVILSVDGPTGQVVGVAVINILVSDTSSDLVELELEYDLLGDQPDVGYQLATPAGQGANELIASPAGSSFTYFWNVLADEGFTEHDVNMRLVANDGDVDGTPEKFALSIDNNSAPIASLENIPFFTSSDRRGVIPLAFTVFDGNASTGESGDEVQLAFQWRNVPGNFPPLPSSPTEIAAILADPDLRREFQVATEAPVTFEGVAVHDVTEPADESAVRLPELLTTASSLVTRDPKSHELDVHGELEIFRRHTVPFRTSAPRGFFDRPFGAVALPYSTHVLVVDAPAGGGWRLREIDLGRMESVGLDVSGAGAGVATAMALESKDGSVLIASDSGGNWCVQRAGPGGFEELIAADGSTELGSVRGIVALGSESALITVGSSLIKLSYPPGEVPRASELFSPATANGPLQTPWGLALDPLDTDRVFVAEKGADRVTAIELSTLERTVVPAFGIGFPAPEHIALENFGDRLLVVTDADEFDGLRELRAIDLGDSWDSTGGAGSLETYELVPGIGQAPALPEPVGSITAGPAGLRLVALTSSNDLAVGGGVEQVRTITSYVHATQTVRVDAPFDPPFAAGHAGRPWRVQKLGADTISADPEGTTGIFRWDSADADGTEIEIRLVPFDSDVGLPDSTGGARTIFPYFGGEVATLGNAAISSFNRVVRAGDLDGDGDLDVVTVDDDFMGGFAVFYQTDPGEFTAGETIGDPNVYGVTRDVELADLDGDGDLDLVGQYGVLAGNDESRAVSVLFQTSPGTFSAGTLIAEATHLVAAADLDDDGDIDIVTQNAGIPPSIDIYFQETPGTFGEPLVLSEYAIPFDLDSGSSDVVLDLQTDDLNADGKLDVYFVHDGSIITYMQTAPGLFTLGPLVTPSALAGAVSSHDVDLDGDVDLVIGSLSPELGGRAISVTFLLQTSPGTFEEGPVVTDGLSGPVVSLTLGDLDADGDVDLVTGNQGTPNLTVFFQGEPGEFTLRTQLHQNSSWLYDVEVADVDGDGALDILTADTQANTVSVFFAGNRPEFRDGPRVGNSQVSPGVRNVVQGDLDGDGNLDFVTANAEGDSLTVFFQRVSGAYELGLTIPLSGAFSGLDLGDLDRDGDLDIAAATPTSLAVFMQVSRDEYLAQPPLPIPSALSTEFVEVVDLDSDGDLDLVALSQHLAGATGSAGNITIFLQTSPGEFGPPIVVGDETSVAAKRCEVVDIDSDGDLDLVVANQVTGDISIFTQVGSGVFDWTAVGPSGPAGERVFEVYADDMDGNGAPDLIVLDQGFGFAAPPSVRLRHRTSGGAFLDGDIIASISLFTGVMLSLDVGDLDSDGDQDLVVAGVIFPPLEGAGLTPYLQVRPDSFVARPALGSDVGLPQSTVAVIGDFDSDGDLDLAMNEVINGFVQIFFGSH